MKKATVVGFLAIALMACQSNAVDIRYQTSGDWFKTVAADGFGWQAPGLPGAADTARINWGGNTVTLAGSAPTIFRLQIGVDESGTLDVNSGGVLTTSEHVFAGNNGGAAVTGTLNVNDGGTVNVGNILWSAFQTDTVGNINLNSGGSISVASHLWLGYRGTSTINISGTLTQTGGILGLGTNDAVNPGGGTAIVNILDGGLLALNNISGNPGLPSIQPGSVVDIAGSGQLTVPGDVIGLLNDYVNAGKITGNGGSTALAIDLTKNPGFTTAYIIPEPATLLLLGLGLTGAMVSRRR